MDLVLIETSQEEIEAVVKEDKNIINTKGNNTKKKKIQIEETEGNSEDGDYAMEGEGIALDRVDDMELDSNKSNKGKDRIKKFIKNEVNESLQSLKTAEDFDRGTAIMRLDNITLECEINDVKKEIIVLNTIVHRLEEK